MPLLPGERPEAAAYGWPAELSDEQILEKLLALEPGTRCRRSESREGKEAKSATREIRRGIDLSAPAITNESERSNANPDGSDAIPSGLKMLPATPARNPDSILSAHGTVVVRLAGPGFSETLWD